MYSFEEQQQLVCTQLFLKTLMSLYFCLILDKGTFLRISTISNCSFLTLIPPYSSGHARKHWNYCVLLVRFSLRILAVRTRGSEGREVSRGRSMANWPISTVLVRSLATLLGSSGNLEVTSMWRPQKLGVCFTLHIIRNPPSKGPLFITRGPQNAPGQALGDPW